MHLQHLAWRSHTRCRCASCRAAAAKPSCRPRGDSFASPRRSWRSKDVQSTGGTSETSETSDKCEQGSLSVHVWVEIIKPGQSHLFKWIGCRAESRSSETSLMYNICQLWYIISKNSMNYHESSVCVFNLLYSLYIVIVFILYRRRLWHIDT